MKKDEPTRHDKIRQILHESGFKFKDSDRTALDMTDAEVDEWMGRFVVAMTELGNTLRDAMQRMATAMTQAVEPLQNLGELLKEGGVEEGDN